ncbi:hypothetical protein [Rhizobium tumorigenes]|uniref:Uncharacterized protein n=1 Tax=Rhizobium tumorigenes TaxID=2041385 RepID=A0AAF1KWQ5_9HYPH|nr:hypothetical protein [Rhizobium tumorigenes]WFR97599.1 hypothetical protein PR017_20575 [Rhizobium tumorigenes]WFS03202.1 hypothetical protein PR016_21320 [Rhizobium tumorigenes]
MVEQVGLSQLTVIDIDGPMITTPRSVMQLTVDKREGVQNLDIGVSDADEIVTLNWLSKLNGQEHTLLGLERDDGWQVMVGGGPIYYVVTLGVGTRAVQDRTLRSYEP